MVEKLYPFEFASIESSNTFDGQATTHKLQPLHRSIFTTTAPFTFAICLLFKNCRTNVTKIYLHYDFDASFFYFFALRNQNNQSIFNGALLISIFISFARITILKSQVLQKPVSSNYVQFRSIQYAQHVVSLQL